MWIAQCYQAALFLFLKDRGLTDNWWFVILNPLGSAYSFVSLISTIISSSAMKFPPVSFCFRSESGHLIFFGQVTCVLHDCASM